MSFAVAITQRKGGVGKTTITTHLAAGFARLGHRVLIIDTDSQGDAARMLGMTPRDGLYAFIADGAEVTQVIEPVPTEAYYAEHEQVNTDGTLFILPSWARTFAIPSVTDNPFRLAERVKEFEGLFDVVMIDTAPTLSALDAYIYLACDAFIHVTECEALSANGLAEGLHYVGRFSKHRAAYHVGNESAMLGIVPNKMRPNTANHRANLELIAEDYGEMVWSPLMQRTKYAEATNFGQLIYAYAPGSYEAQEMNRLTLQAEGAIVNVIV